MQTTEYDLTKFKPGQKFELDVGRPHGIMHIELIQPGTGEVKICLLNGETVIGPSVWLEGAADRGRIPTAQTALKIIPDRFVVMRMNRHGGRAYLPVLGFKPVDRFRVAVAA